MGDFNILEEAKKKAKETENAAKNVVENTADNVVQPLKSGPQPIKRSKGLMAIETTAEAVNNEVQSKKTSPELTAIETNVAAGAAGAIKEAADTPKNIADQAENSAKNVAAEVTESKNEAVGAAKELAENTEEKVDAEAERAMLRIGEYLTGITTSQIMVFVTGIVVLTGALWFMKGRRKPNK